MEVWCEKRALISGSLIRDVNALAQECREFLDIRIAAADVRLHRKLPTEIGIDQGRIFVKAYAEVESNRA